MRALEEHSSTAAEAEGGTAVAESAEQAEAAREVAAAAEAAIVIPVPAENKTESFAIEGYKLGKKTAVAIKGQKYTVFCGALQGAALLWAPCKAPKVLLHYFRQP